MELWFAAKMIKNSIRRAIYPIMGFVFGISSLILVTSLGQGGEYILKNDLNAIGQNRIILGGAFTEKDILMIEELPFIEYLYLPGAKEKKGDITWIAAPSKYLKMLGVTESLKEGEGIAEEKTLGLLYDNSDLKFRNEKIRLVQSYKENSPLEMMKNENRILVNMEAFGIREQKEILLSFMEGYSPYEYLPIIKSILDKNHLENAKIEILETPVLYKKIQEIKRNVKIILSLLASISLILGGTGITSLIASSVRERTYYIGILRSMGLGKKRVYRIFLNEAAILAAIGGTLGTVMGATLSVAIGRILNIPPIFSIGVIAGTEFLSIILGIVFGISPARKAASQDIKQIMGNL